MRSKVTRFSWNPPILLLHPNNYQQNHFSQLSTLHHLVVPFWVYQSLAQIHVQHFVQWGFLWICGFLTDWQIQYSNSVVWILSFFFWISVFWQLQWWRQRNASFTSVVHSVAVCTSVAQSVAVYCSMLRCVEMPFCQPHAVQQLPACHRLGN